MNELLKKRVVSRCYYYAGMHPDSFRLPQHVAEYKMGFLPGNLGAAERRYCSRYEGSSATDTPVVVAVEGASVSYTGSDLAATQQIKDVLASSDGVKVSDFELYAKLPKGSRLFIVQGVDAPTQKGG
jgi:hypothetical protein